MIATYQKLLSLPHVCRCMYPDFVVWDQRTRRSACAPHSLINKNIKHFVGPDLGPNCQLLLSAADKVSKTAWCLRSKPPLLLLARGDLGFAHKTWLPSQKVLSEGGGPTLTTFFLLDDGREDPNTTKAGHHWPASETPLNWRFADWWPNMGCWLGSFVILGEPD